MNLRPPGVRLKFEDNPAPVQADLISYSQIRDLEDAQLAGMRLGI